MIRLGMGLEIKRATGGTVTQKETGMNALLHVRRYTGSYALTRHRLEHIAMSALELQKIFVRHEIGRQTRQDREWFVYDTGMSIGTFVDKNNIEIIEPVYWLGESRGVFA